MSHSAVCRPDARLPCHVGRPVLRGADGPGAGGAGWGGPSPHHRHAERRAPRPARVAGIRDGRPDSRQVSERLRAPLK